MPIRYVPNDPIAGAPNAREISPHAGRQQGRAGFRFANEQAEGVFNEGTDGFLFWQCREAAHRALDAWEEIDGPIARWAQNKPTLSLISDGAR